MSYRLFRLSLIAKRKPPLLEGMRATPLTSRQNYLKSAFSKPVTFVYRKVAFDYLYITNIDDTLASRIGRPKRERRTGDRAAEYAPFDDIGNIAINIFIDTASDPDGQKAAVQVNPAVGSAAGIIEELIQKINDDGIDADWQIEVRPIINETDFWDVVEENKQSITSIQLKLVAPNVLGLTGNIVDEMRVARDENNAAIISIGIENKEGIKLDTPSIRNAIKYVSEGAGDAVLKFKRKILFDNRKKQRSVSVHGDAPVARGSEVVLKAIKTILFGR